MHQKVAVETLPLFSCLKFCFPSSNFDKNRVSLRKQTGKGVPVVRHSGLWKWGLVVLALVVFLMAGAGLVLFCVNDFSFELRLAGEETIYLEYGDRYTEPGAEAVLTGSLLWQEGITPEVSLTVENPLDENTLGKYHLTYTAQFLWWEASAQRTVWVVDPEPPVITLTGDGAAHIAGTPYEEEGFTATDNYDGDITDRVVRTEDMGRITYTVLDSSGNFAVAQREVPYLDPVPPEIILTEGEHIIHKAGTRFVDPGFTAMDTGDGDVTEAVSVTGEVTWYKPGSYPLTYSVSDSHGNASTVTRTVEVKAEPRPETVMPEGKPVYLTFDDGPGPYTEELLDVLDKYGVKATFFVVNTDSVELVKEIADRGHSIGIHSVTHNYNEIYTSPEAYFHDLYTMQDIIYQHTGVKTTLMRFPGGSSNMVSCYNEGIMTLLTQAVQDAGFQYFDWNVDSNDAGGATRTSTVRNNVIQGIQEQPFSIVLQHDIHAFSVAAVEDIIVWGLENGYTFLPLEENSPTVHHGLNN